MSEHRRDLRARDSGHISRRAARVLVIDAAEHVLLLQVRMSQPDGGQQWILPGGGIRPGERSRDAAIRELVEETGLRDVTLLCRAWQRRATFAARGRTYDQTESVYVGHCPRVRPPTIMAPTNEDELMPAVRHRWWTVEEIRSAPDIFVPENLATKVQCILRASERWCTNR